MDLTKYNKKKYSNGEIISEFIIDYVSLNNCSNILFVRTPTTGAWLDNIFQSEQNFNITRILYQTNKTNIKYTCDQSTIITESENLSKILSDLDKKYDLICVDVFHEYDESIRDFELFEKYLDYTNTHTHTSTIISHDCYPPTKQYAIPNFFIGNWCGHTYIAFIEFAYKNPHLYYGLINIDTGIGIASTNNSIGFLTNNLDTITQKKLLDVYKDIGNTTPNKKKLKKSDIYNFFCKKSKKLINSINL